MNKKIYYEILLEIPCVYCLNTKKIFLKEVRNGLVINFYFSCLSCHKALKYTNSNKILTNRTFELNKRNIMAVELSGCSRTEYIKLFSLMNIKPISMVTLNNTEELSKISLKLSDEMIENNLKEICLDKLKKLENVIDLFENEKLSKSFKELPIEIKLNIYKYIVI